MSFNTFGHSFRVTTFGESHGPAIGCVVDGCPPRIALSEADIQPYLDRPFKELSPVEIAILLLGTHELASHLEIPYRAVINEAVELAKTYGGTHGHKYVNGVLDKLAVKLRTTEVHARA